MTDIGSVGHTISEARRRRLSTITPTVTIWLPVHLASNVTASEIEKKQTRSRPTISKASTSSVKSYQRIKSLETLGQPTVFLITLRSSQPSQPPSSHTRLRFTSYSSSSATSVTASPQSFPQASLSQPLLTHCISHSPIFYLNL